MKNVLKLIGIIAFAAIIGFSFAACGSSGDDNTTPSVPQTPGNTKTIVSIAVTTPPTKTEYNLGETFDPAGLVVTATYSDGTSEAITGYSTSGFSSATTGNKIIIVTYQEKTAEFTVNVIDPSLPTVAAPTASPTGGTYATAQNVTLTTTTGGAAIYYTINGTEPTKGSTPYTTAINIGVTTTLKAFAVKAGMNDSDIITAVYTIDSGTDPGPGPGQGTRPTITTTSPLPNATVGIPYSTTLTATGDTPITWSLDGSTLPTGLTLSPEGVISGTPTTGDGIATPISFKATNAAGYDQKSLYITIDTLPDFNTIAAFKTWLDAKPANTAATAYGVKLGVSNLGSFPDDGSVGKTLTSNSGKYVSLDISGSTVTTINDSTFCVLAGSIYTGCATITSITLPNTLTSINNNAFRSCNNLAEINVTSTNTAYSSEDGVLYNKAKTTLVMYPVAKKSSTFTIPGGVTEIGNYAFRACNNLTGVTIPDGVTGIGTNAFEACLYITSVTIPNSVTSIGASAFSNCNSLASVTLPNNITSISNNTFRYCAQLTSINIPASVTSIGENAFNSCEKLTIVTFNNINSTFNANSFPGTGLSEAYSAEGGGIGTYKLTGSTWSKQN